jgi:hypothetical protein
VQRKEEKTKMMMMMMMIIIIITIITIKVLSASVGSESMLYKRMK